MLLVPVRRTIHQSTLLTWKYISTYSLALAPDGSTAPDTPGAYWTGCWVGAIINNCVLFYWDFLPSVTQTVKYSEETKSTYPALQTSSSNLQAAVSQLRRLVTCFSPRRPGCARSPVCMRNSHWDRFHC
jgi:hypothetical protein